MYFPSKFEKNLINQYIKNPFNSYSIDKNTALFDLLCVFCSAATHNDAIHPDDIPKKKQYGVFYCAYAIGIVLTCANEKEDRRKDIINSGMHAFANSAKQNGMNSGTIDESLQMISYITDLVMKHIEKAKTRYIIMNHLEETDDECNIDERSMCAATLLAVVGIKPSPEKTLVLSKVFDQFKAAYKEWNELTHLASSNKANTDKADKEDKADNTEYTLDEEDKKYIEYIIEKSGGKIRYDEAERFMQICYIGHDKGKQTALKEFDILARDIIAEDDLLPIIKLPFLAGLLYPNGVLSKEETDQLSTKYVDLFQSHIKQKYSQ